MIKHEPRAHVEMPPDRKYSPQGEPRTVFISKIPKKGITDDVLYADFSGFGRVLATKVFIPKTLIQGKPDKVVHFGAFIEFATSEAAMDVINTLKEYRGVATGVKWAHRSLVDSIKELQRREVGDADDDERVRETIQASTSGHGAVRVASDMTASHPGFARYGTLYVTEDVVYEQDGIDHAERACQDPVGSFIREQAQLWHQELRAYYATGCTPAVLPPPAPVGPLLGPPMPAPGPPPPPVRMMPPMVHYHHHHSSGMTAMHTYPAGMPITPIPPIPPIYMHERNHHQ